MTTKRSRSVPEGLSPSSPEYSQFAANWHRQEVADILAELETSIASGLSAVTIEQNLAKYGSNTLAKPQPRTGIIIFLSYFWSIPVALLTLAAILSVITGSPIDALVIMVVVVINGILGYVTESKSERIILALKNIVNPVAWVIREGAEIKIDAQAVVVGDLLLLKPGSYIAADARVIESDRLKVDESVLTGESVPVSKTSHVLLEKDLPLAERSNMVYRGTFVTSGSGLGVVVAAGQQTEMGKIQSLVTETKIPQTPLEIQLERAGSQLVLLSSSVCAVVLALGIVRGYGFIEMLQTSIALAVAAVPEGLPTVATITLALGINNMRQQGVLVRRLDAIEALGSVQTICLDKTGTLTTNQMSVVEIQTLNNSIGLEDNLLTKEQSNGQDYKPLASLDSTGELLQLIEVAVLCNESKINIVDNNGELGELQIVGSPTETALVQMAIAAGLDVTTIKTLYPLVEIIHRANERNYMATVHQLNQSHKLIAVKGNPLEVLAICQYKLRDNQLVALNELDRHRISNDNQRMTANALRVLGTAYAEIEATDKIELKNLTWLGLIGITNPIREGVRELITDFHQAGIDTVMLTGDQENTAQAIAKQLNLNRSSTTKETNVFARISPADKLEIVQTFQAAGKVVAMTGDGINDAPALKAAEVGIAMGKTGTDVAREVADIVLADDNLETAIAAVSQGRTIYNNIKKALHFLLSTNLSEIIVMVMANLLGMGLPLNAIQLLWLNLVTDIFPGLALGLEAPEPNVLQLPPRSPQTPIIETADFKRLGFEAMIISGFTLLAYAYGILNYGIGDRASTIAFMTLVTAQLLHALSCRSQQPFWQIKLQPNHYLTLALGVSLGLQLICLIVPSLGSLLKITTVNEIDLIVMAIAAFLPLIINEVTKKVIVGWAKINI